MTELSRKWTRLFDPVGPAPQCQRTADWYELKAIVTLITHRILAAVWTPPPANHNPPTWYDKGVEQ